MSRYRRPYSGPRQYRTMSDIFEEYRKGIPHGQYQSNSELKSLYRGLSGNFPKTEYSREPSTARGERERIEQTQTKADKPSENKEEIKNIDSQKIETNQETKNLQKIELTDMQESKITTPRQLPIVELGDKKFFLDERLQEIRNIEDPFEKISFEDLDLIPEKTEQSDQYQKAEIIEIFNLPKYETELEFGQTNTKSKNRPSPSYDKSELRW